MCAHVRMRAGGRAGRLGWLVADLKLLSFLVEARDPALSWELTQLALWI